MPTSLFPPYFSNFTSTNVLTTVRNLLMFWTVNWNMGYIYNSRCEKITGALALALLVWNAYGRAGWVQGSCIMCNIFLKNECRLYYSQFLHFFTVKVIYYKSTRGSWKMFDDSSMIQSSWVTSILIITTEFCYTMVLYIIHWEFCPQKFKG